MVCLALSVSQPRRVPTPDQGLSQNTYQSPHVDMGTCMRSTLPIRHLLQYASCLEYTKRYHKVHACQKHFEYLNHLGFPGNDSNESQKERKTILATKDIPHGLQYIPLCMPHEYIVYDEQKQPLGIESYQKYYISKQHAFKMIWTKTKTPSFFIKYNNVS